MSCASCAVRVDKALNGLPGVESAHVNYASATARVAYRPGECSPGVLKRAVQAARLRPADRRGRPGGGRGGARPCGALPGAQTADSLGGGALSSDRGRRHAVHGRSGREIRRVGALHPGRFRTGTGVLRQRLETAPPRGGQHGYAGCRQYRNRLSVQPFQPVFPGILAVEGHRAARLFRVGGRHRRLHPAGAAA